MRLANILQVVGGDAASGGGKDIADKENSHGRVGWQGGNSMAFLV
jgi:hypothetical protein